MNMIYNEKRDLFGNITREMVNEETGKISKLSFEPEIIKIESFTEKGLFYEIDKKNHTCSCPAFQKQSRKMCKHLKKVLFSEEEEKGFSISLLKSAEQKAIRRGNVERAVKCAKIHLRKNVNDFWRRLAVVVIEDVVLHPEYRRIVDLSSITVKKSYIRNEEDDKFGLKIVEQLTRCEYRDFEFEDYFQNLKIESFDDIYTKYSELSEEEKSLVDAMKWRSKMGGMGGDMRMLELMSKIWTYRFADKKMSINDLTELFPQPQINYDEVENEEKVEDILLEACDFHATPLLNILMKKDWIITLIKSRFNTEDKEEIIHYLKDIVWRLRSAVSYKKCLDTGKQYDWLGSGDGSFYKMNNKENYIDIFSKIKEQCDGISSWFIKKSIEK